MNGYQRLIGTLLLLLCASTGPQAYAAAPLRDAQEATTSDLNLRPAPLTPLPVDAFVTRSGASLMLKGKPFRFISWNVPNLHIVEDDTWRKHSARPADRNPPYWHRVSEAEQLDAIQTVAQLGGQVIRLYPFSIQGGLNNGTGLSHYNGPQQPLQEELMRDYDRLIALSRQHGIRLIVPFIDQWRWFGGLEEFVRLSGGGDFYTDRTVIENYKAMLRQIVLRVNTITGIPYHQDPTIMAWQLGNELRDVPPAWTAELAAFVKSLAPQQLLMSGSMQERAALLDPNVDILTSHYYQHASGQDFVSRARSDQAIFGQTKPFIIGEFGCHSTDQLVGTMDVVLHGNMTGALLWSLRFRSEEGGFYWHREGTDFASYRWPGFKSNAASDEQDLLAKTFERAWAIQGYLPPPRQVPAPPRILPSSTPEALAWFGSVGAEFYSLERSLDGITWTPLADHLSDADVPFQPFQDLNAPTDGPIQYRMRAHNIAGVSEWSPSFLTRARAPEKPQPVPQDFVKRKHGQLFLADQVFRFIGLAAPNLYQNAEQLDPDFANRWPDAFELSDTLDTLQQLGSRATRSFTLSIQQADGVPALVQGIGQYNEEAFRSLDRVLKESHDRNIRIIVPLIDSHNFPGIGGISAFTAFLNKDKTLFWTDPAVRDAYKQLLYDVLHRRNHLTGIRYKDDPTILAWQLGNELDSFISDNGLDLGPHKTPDPALREHWMQLISTWSVEMAAHLKHLDPNHLVMEGGGNVETFLADPNIDILSQHYYPFWEAYRGKRVRGVDENRRLRALTQRAGKALIVDEFGLGDTPDLRAFMDEVIRNGTTGALLWSLRGHRRDGGFYYHNESGTQFNSYHWPGFPSGDRMDERRMLALLRNRAYRIQGLRVPPLPRPEGIPLILPPLRPQALHWRGVTGASHYEVERRELPHGPWRRLASHVTDDDKKRRMFSDVTATSGQQYEYRVRARNASGTGPFSAPYSITATFTSAPSLSTLSDTFDHPMQSWTLKWAEPDERLRTETLIRRSAHQGLRLSGALRLEIPFHASQTGQKVAVSKRFAAPIDLRGHLLSLQVRRSRGLRDSVPMGLAKLFVLSSDATCQSGVWADGGGRALHAGWKRLELDPDAPNFSATGYNPQFVCELGVELSAPGGSVPLDAAVILLDALVIE